MLIHCNDLGVEERGTIRLEKGICPGFSISYDLLIVYRGQSFTVERKLLDWSLCLYISLYGHFDLIFNERRQPHGEIVDAAGTYDAAHFN